MTKFLRILFLLTILLSLLFSLPYTYTPIIREKVQLVLDTYLKAQTSFGKISINFQGQSISIENIYIQNGDQNSTNTSLFIKRISVYPDLGTLISNVFIIKKILVENPIYIHDQKSDTPINLDIYCNKDKPSCSKIKNNLKKRFRINEILINNGAYYYRKRLPLDEIQLFQVKDISISLDQYLLPREYIENIPLNTKISITASLPTTPEGTLVISGNSQYKDKALSFNSDIALNNISIPYIKKLFQHPKTVKIIDGSFSLLGNAKCVKDELYTKPTATVKNIKLEAPTTSETIQKLPVALIINFFNIHKDDLSFEFEIKGNICKPNFLFHNVIYKKIPVIMSSSILDTIKHSPQLALKLKDIALVIPEKIKEIGKTIEETIKDGNLKNLEKPLKELLKEVKGEKEENEEE